MNGRPYKLPSHYGFAVGVIAVFGMVGTALARPPAFRAVPLAQGIAFWSLLLVAAFLIPRFAEWFYGD